jgi:hypothetical protein
MLEPHVPQETNQQDSSGSLLQRALPVKSPSLAILLTKKWWHYSLLTAVLFMRHCWLAGTVWTATLVTSVIGTWYASAHLAPNGVATLESMLVSAGASFLTVGVSLALMLWSVGAWLIADTAYSRAYLELPLLDAISAGPAIREKQRSCALEARHQKLFLAKFWFYNAVFLLVPVVILTVLSLVKTIEVSAISGVKLFTLSPLANAVILTLIGFLTIVLTQVSSVGLAVSSRTKLEPLAAAKQTMSLSWRFAWQGFLITTVVILLNIVVSSPQVLFKLNDLNSLFVLSNDIVPLLLACIWQGVSSIFLWTFSMAPICEIVRDHID